MKKILLVLWFFFGLVLVTMGQKKSLKKGSFFNRNLAAGQIVSRNNCITQCANCDSARGPDQSTIFEYSINLPPQFKYTWSYGEGNARSSGRTGRYQYCTPGNKQVKVVFQDTTTVSGTRDSVSTTIKIGQLANYSIKLPKPDTTICLGQKVLLDPFKTIAKQANVGMVRWFPDGQMTDQITVEKTGCYTAKIFSNDTSGCYVEAKIQVNICGESDPDRNLNRFSEAWDFGTGVRVRFAGSPTSATVETSPISVPQGVAKMSDGTKSLIFYTDGVKVFSRFGDDITYGANLNGDITNSQGVSIVPKPSCKGCQSDYYVFTLSKDPISGENKLYYSLVDMSIVKIKPPGLTARDTVRGGVTIRNQLVGPVPTTQRIYATFGGEDYYWLVAQDANSNVIRKYKVTSAGISAPIKSNEGTPVSASSSGNTRISASGTKMAVTIPATAGSNNKIDLFGYNALTGKDSLLVTVDLGPAPPTIYGVEFSPDERKLYVSFTGDGTAANKSKIVQYDLTFFNKDSILRYQHKLYETVGKIGALQLDPVYQSVIFVAIQDSTYLSAIVNPNNKFTTDPTKISVEYRSQLLPFPSFPTSTITSELGLPPSIPSPPTPNSLPTISMECVGTKFKFKLDKNLCDPIKNEQIRWVAYKSRISRIPDMSGTIVPLDKTQIVSQNPNTQEFEVDFPAGPNEYYTITAEITNRCVTNFMLDAQEFLVQVIKPFKLENVEKIVPTVSTINCTLNHLLTPTQVPPQSTITYEWNTGATTKDLLVNNPGGEFTLTISDTTGCSATQKAKVTFFPQKELLQKPDWIICMDDPTPRLALEVLPLANAISYNWSAVSYVESGVTVPAGVILSTDVTKNKIEVGKDGGYKLEAKDFLGCEVSENYNIPDKCKPLIIAPTVFNPKKISSDGSTNKFYPLWNWPIKDFLAASTPIPNSVPFRSYQKTRSKILSFKVFNRWGQLIFQRAFDPASFNLDATFDIKSYGWDGTYNGELVPQDTYAWTVEYESIDFPNGKESKSGAVLIVY